MVFTIHNHKSGVAAKQFQGGEHLDALSNGDVGVGAAVQKQQRSVDLVCHIQRAVVHIEVLCCPGVAVCHRDFAVGIAPVALAPVTCVVTDAGVGDAGSKNVALCQQQLGHKAAVGGAEAADVLAVHIRMILAETVHSLQDILCHALAGSIHVAGCEFLPEARSPRRIHNIEYVALGGIILRRV